jgi:predicted lipoprotein with Yx(FWY)xxD motif
LLHVAFRIGIGIIKLMSKTIWAIIVIIIIVVGGWFIYQSMSATTTPATTTTTDTTGTQTTGAATSDNIYLSASDPVKGAYMTDFAGKTLYTFDKDTTPGQSSCTGTCATAWPPYTSGAAAQCTLPTNVTLITRADGSQQFAWMGKPLYYYALDTAAGQLKGDGVGGTWHIIKM